MANRNKSTQKAAIVEIPSFVMEQEGIFDKLFDRVLSIRGKKDIDFIHNPVFSKKLKLTGDNESDIRKLFTKELLTFLESEEVYHIESNGRAMIIFKSLRVANTGEIKNMVRFSRDLVQHISKQ